MKAITPMFLCLLAVLANGPEALGQENEDSSSLHGVLGHWSSLEEELMGVVKENGAAIDSATFLKSAAFRKLAESKNPALWYEMAAQRDHHAVKLGGFYCIRERRPKDALRIALQVLIRRRQDEAGYFFRPLYDHIAGADVSPANLRALSTVDFVDSLQRRSALVLIVDRLSAEFLEAWLDQHVDGGVTATAEAIVLDEFTSRGTSIARKHEERLDAFSVIPGFPRLAFIFHTDRRDDFFREVVKSAIEDPSVADMELRWVLAEHRDYVAQHIDLATMELPQSRRDSVEAVIKKQPD